MLPARINIGSAVNDRGVAFNERCELFAGHFVGTRNPGQAFRLAFVPDKAMALSAINAQAQRLLADPEMRRRIQSLIDAAAASTQMNIRALLTDFHDIATADPNEIVSHVVDCCRYCHGVGFKWQWTTETAYAAECARIMELNAALPPTRAQQSLPDCSGGFGYDPRNEPHPLCPECFGRGIGQVLFHDTTRLSPAARKLYKGAKQTKFGMEIELHDQRAAADALMRVAGAFKDAMPLNPPAASSNDDAIEGQVVTEAEAGKAYLALVAGTPPR